MNEKISALMDGELSREDVNAAIEALRAGGDAREAWRTYHAIGDAMRETRMLGRGFVPRVTARIEKEPTVIAPAAAHAWRGERRWPALSIAASLAALALVIGTVVVTQQDPAAPQVAQQLPQKPAAATASEVPQVPPPDAAHDYLLAHQASSPRNSLQGIAPYVRMVSGQAAPAKPKP